jgi:hypothetical protein
LLRCRNGDAWVTDTGRVRDDDEIRDTFTRILVARGAGWDLTTAGDYPEERIASRWRQKMLLARYGHQPISVWEHRPVEDLQRAMEALREIMEKENPVTRATE